MRCDQVQPFLPGYSGGELRAETDRIVGDHVASCADCSVAVGQLDRVRAGLATLIEHEIEPPPFLVEAVLEQVEQARNRRFVASRAEVTRLVGEHKREIASAAGTAVVAAGAVYALWRAVRGRRAAPQPVTG